MRRFLLAILQNRKRPPLFLGILIAAACVVLETCLAKALEAITPTHALDVVYLLGIVVVASVWGLALGVGMAVVSTAAFDYYLTPPPRSLSLTASENWTVLAIFIAIALLAASISRLARSLADQAEAHTEAEFAAEMARLLLRAPDLKTAMPAAARHLVAVLGLPSARIELDATIEDDRQVSLPLRDGGEPVGALLVPEGLTRPQMRRLQDRVMPSLEVMLHAARERERVADALKASNEELGRVAEEQAALRRLATLVAHAVPPTEIFGAVAREVGEVLGAMHTTVIRYEPGDVSTSVGVWSQGGPLATMPLDARWTVERGSASELVARTRAPGRIHHYTGAGELVTALRDKGIRSSVACPIVVGGRLWGAVIAASTTETPMPPETEERMLGFTELVAAAVANAENHAELIASRARIAATADATRRLIERDLHDGTQQRLVSIKLEMRAVLATIPPGLEELKGRLFGTAHALEEAIEDLREVSRGLHPAILSRGGLRLALKGIAQRSAIPVDLDVRIARRLPERIEVSTYYVISEALTNAVKYSRASTVRISLAAEDSTVRLSVRDDGDGGAEVGGGSGLIGLKDRVETLGGRIDIVSPVGGGTSLFAEIPVDTP